jgi:flagellin
MLGITQGTLSKSTEKLSSGYKINRAADDAAGLSISEKMRKQIRGLTQASANAEDGISAVQTAEGALTEVHDMLQRMNELATKAANGTMSVDDRQTVQDEISQLTTEIDRVAETTKFNETYLLKGDADSKTVHVNAHDAGITGTLTQNSAKATFTMKELKLGDTISIGGKEYTIGSTIGNVKTSIGGAIPGQTVTIDGTSYTVTTAGAGNADKNILDTDALKEKVKAGSTVVYNGKTLKAIALSETDITGVAGDNVAKKDYEDGTIVTKAQAYKMIADELVLASSVGATKSNASLDGQAPTQADTKGNVEFKIKKGTVEKKEDMSFSLHVGADADGTNKISVNLSALTSAGLGIDGINVKDSTGANATYAIDAIADAISKVSTQRSALGAVQNRLEHTINNLDNVVENTTSAESQIRDTDMATEMVKYSNANILSQAGQSMLAQANQSNQGVLSLLG